MTAWLLVASIFLPLVGVGVIRTLPLGSQRQARWVALATVLVTFIISIFVAAECLKTGPSADPLAPPGSFTQTFADWDWLSQSSVADSAGGAAENPFATLPAKGLSIKFSLGLDGLTLWLYALSGLLMITSVLVSWEAIGERPAAFYSMLLVLETGMLGVFAARDIILFYIFFEATLIPLFFLIGIWGGSQRRYAAVKFFVYTLAGSMLTFLGLLAIVILQYRETGILTFSIAELIQHCQENPFTPIVQFTIFVALFAGFAIKVPLFPLHTWLPLAHVEAPTAGSILLAGILLKIGTYGFARFNLTMLPVATVHCMPWIVGLSVAGIIYGALVALAQSDIKKLIAYSSVSHLGFCMLGLFALNSVGMTGGVLQMIGHGLSTGGLFAVVGMLYERYHTREIDQFRGMAKKLPALATFMLILTFASVGLPATSGFAGEFMILTGIFQRAWAEPLRDQYFPVLPINNAALDQIPYLPGPTVLNGYQTVLLPLAVLATLGMLLGAWYMLWLMKQVFFGPLKEPHHDDHGAPIQDLSLREIAALVPLIVMIFWIGLCPQFFVAPMSPTLTATLEHVRQPWDMSKYAQAPATEPQVSLHTSGEPSRVE